MFDTLCTYPLPSDLLAQAIHPSEPVIALGLATGHVSLHRLPPSSASESPKNGCGTIDTAWRTRRHKGSCRALTFSPDGTSLFSAGVDGVVKIAETETGWVGRKIAVPLHKGTPDPPTLLSTPTPSSLLLATESGALHVYDVRLPPTTTTTSSSSTSTTATPSSPKPTHSLPALHADFITSLSPLPTTPSQILTTGAATVSITDLRSAAVLITSADQDEELLSSTVCEGKAVVGGEKGVLRVWDVGVWNDEERVIDVARGRGGTLDVLAAAAPGEDGPGRAMCAVGCDDGLVAFVDVGAAARGQRVRGQLRHDDVEGVVGLGWLSDGRLVSGGGAAVKIWEEAGARQSYSSDEDGGDGIGDEGEVGGEAMKRRDGVLGSDDEEEEEEDGESAGLDDSEEEEEKPKKRGKKKKKKRGKGKKGQVGNGIMAFKGLT